MLLSLQNVSLKSYNRNIETTFNAITVDSDTSTNDMLTMFSTGKVKNSRIDNILDEIDADVKVSEEKHLDPPRMRAPEKMDDLLVKIDQKNHFIKEIVYKY